jgi:hypothetical protein
MNTETEILKLCDMIAAHNRLLENLITNEKAHDDKLFALEARLNKLEHGWK